MAPTPGPAWPINGFVHSNDFTDPTWLARDCSVTPASGESVAGVSASRLTMDATSDVRHAGIRRDLADTPFDLSVQSCYSMFVKPDGYHLFRIHRTNGSGLIHSALFDTNMLTVDARYHSSASGRGAGVYAVGGGWFRCWFALQIITGSAPHVYFSCGDLASAGAYWHDITCDGVSGMFVAGGQLDISEGPPSAYKYTTNLMIASVPGSTSGFTGIGTRRRLGT